MDAITLDWDAVRSYAHTTAMGYRVPYPSLKNIKHIPSSAQARATTALPHSVQTSASHTTRILSHVSLEIIPILFSFRSIPIQWSRNELGPFQLHLVFLGGRCPRNDRTPRSVNISPNCSVWWDIGVYRIHSIRAEARACGLLRFTLQSLIPRSSAVILKMFSPLRISASQGI